MGCKAYPCLVNNGSMGWCMVGGGLTLRRLTGSQEGGDAEAGVAGLEEGEPVGNEPVPVLRTR